MKIEHGSVYVEDLEAAKEFFISYFGATSNDGYHNRKTGLRTYFLTFEDGARLELMTRPGLTRPGAESRRIGYDHLAFAAGSKERVDELTDKLKEAGYEIVSGPRTTGDGYYESCVAGPDGILLEITK